MRSDFSFKSHSVENRTHDIRTTCIPSRVLVVVTSQITTINTNNTVLLILEGAEVVSSILDKIIFF